MLGSLKWFLIEKFLSLLGRAWVRKVPIATMPVDNSNPAHIGYFWGHFNSTPINNAISNRLQTYIQLSYLFRNVKSRPTYLTKFGVNKGGKFNPTPIDRINKSISNTIRLTYKC